MKDRQALLSTLWIFAVLNYLYADVFTMFFVSGAQQEAQAFTQGSQVFVLAFAVLMETAIAMVLLARVLPHGANRWANIVVGVIHTTLVTWSLLESRPTLDYAFFAIIEIACTLFIIGCAWTWRKHGVQPADGRVPLTADSRVALEHSR